MGKPKKKKPVAKQKGGASGKSKGPQLKGGKLRASHILVKKLGEAQHIRDELDAGADFRNLAKQHSTCTSRNKGGDLGFFGKEKMVKTFWDGVVKLQVGQISEPVKSEFGYHIIKRTK